MGFLDHITGGVSFGSGSGNNPADLAGKAQSGIIKSASSLYKNRRGFGVPKFNTWVPFSGQTTSALGQMEGLAGQGNPMAGAGQSAIMGMLGGGDNNPAFARMVDTQAGKIGDDVSAQFGGSAFGSAGHGGSLVENIGNFRDQMWSNNFHQNRADQLAAAQAAPGVYQQQFAPAERLAQVGAANEDLATRKLQSRMDKFYGKQDAPWSRLGAYANIVNGAGQGFANTRAAATPPANPWGGALGGAMLGSNFGPVGAAGGGLMGLLSGLFR